MQQQLSSQASMLKNQDDELKTLQESHEELVTEHNATVTVLENFKVVLADTSVKLHMTETELQKSLASLAHVTQQRDEQRHLVDKHVHQESSLQQEAQSKPTLATGIGVRKRGGANGKGRAPSRGPPGVSKDFKRPGSPPAAKSKIPVKSANTKAKGKLPEQSSGVGRKQLKPSNN